MIVAHSFYHDPLRVELSAPYRPQFVDTLKQVVPNAYRTWQPQTKTWIVRVPYDAAAIEVLVYFFPTAEVGEKSQTGRRRSRTSACQCDADHRALFVCQNAPPEVVRAAYRSLAKLSHPDAGGDHAKMQTINAAYERLTSGARR